MQRWWPPPVSGRCTLFALLLRREAGIRGRRAAWLQLAGLALVAVVLPLTHFAS